MKKSEISLLTIVLLAVCSLTACSPGGYSSEKQNCSSDGEICIHISTVDTFQTVNPVTLKINVTSTEDISDLHVTLRTDYDVKVDGPRNWENYLTATLIEQGYAGWDFSIKAGQTLTFTRVLHYPSHEGWFYVVASAATVGRTLEAVDSFEVLITRDGGYVIRAGTHPPPYTPNVTAAAYGPGTPVPTIILATYPWEKSPSTPTPTLVPVRQTTPTPTTVAPREASPYPPPYP
jgi:hypothetical protein